MIDASAIAEIIATYNKYGWILRRVLLSDASNEKLGKHKETLFGEATISVSEIDAAWFSRPPDKNGVAWEIRYLGEPPYALLEKVNEGDAEFEKILRQTESRLNESLTQKQTA
ncbi:MAG: hypothetical protein ACKVRN_01770 [Pyrinomonadaceae bacterium]